MEESQNSRIKFCVCFIKTHKTTWITIVYGEKLNITVPYGKVYTKIFKNQDFNDFFRLETLAWNNFRQRKLIPNKKELSLFAKICCFWKNNCMGKLFVLWICKEKKKKKKPVGSEKNEIRMITDGASGTPF